MRLALALLVLLPHLLDSVSARGVVVVVVVVFITT